VGRGRVGIWSSCRARVAALERQTDRHPSVRASLSFRPGPLASPLLHAPHILSRSIHLVPLSLLQAAAAPNSTALAAHDSFSFAPSTSSSLDETSARPSANALLLGTPISARARALATPRRAMESFFLHLPPEEPPRAQQQVRTQQTATDARSPSASPFRPLLTRRRPALARAATRTQSTSITHSPRRATPTPTRPPTCTT